MCRLPPSEGCGPGARRPRMRLIIALSRMSAVVPLFATGLFLGCGSEEQSCIDGADVWAAPPSGPFCVDGDLIVRDRHPDELDVLEWVEEITGSLIIYENPGLMELPAFPALTGLGGSLSISANEALTVIRGFPALELLSGELYVANNPSLLQFELGPAVTAVDSVFFAANPSLTEIGGLSSLTRVFHGFRVMENPDLPALALPALAEVGGDFELSGAPALQSAEFPSLRSVQRWAIVGTALPSLSGFSALDKASIAEIRDNDALKEIQWVAADVSWVGLYIYNNSRLERIVGATSAQRIEHIDIGANPALVAIEGFAALEEIDVLAISGNERLESIASFAALERVGYFSITRNPALSGPPTWFPALTTIAGDLSIYGNTSLPPTTVDKLLARVTVGGNARTGDNQGEDTALDPCPWPQDGVCDGDSSWQGIATGLCAADPEDCDGPLPPSK